MKGDGLARAVASVIWTYDGWIAVSMIAGEVVAPERLMKRIIIAGMLTIVILYVGANLAYLYMMPIGVLSQQKEAVARTVMESIAGPAGGTAIMLAMMVSVFGALNGNFLARPRVAFAMARDGLTFSFLGKVHPRFATPWLAMLIQGAGAIGMVLVLRDFDTAHHLLRRRRVGRAHLRRRGGVRAAADDGRCAAAVSHAGISMGADLFVLGTVIGVTAIVWGEIEAGNYSPIYGLFIAAAGFPVHHVWKRVRPR